MYVFPSGGNNTGGDRAPLTGCLDHTHFHLAAKHFEEFVDYKESFRNNSQQLCWQHNCFLSVK